ncbi:unnamed protein product [Caenorhabditis bovis]|uniref:Uncharacterized protein n=1 Tax=Caenorhabditis bovis TaxID=2654633 RepID=A0A8S1ET39_9PELO|nr:unnamed protein product [Caenorhabditis bovis]
MVLIFENRYSRLVETRFKITRKSTRFVYVAVSYMISTLLFVPLLFEEVDEEEARRKFLEVASKPKNAWLVLFSFVQIAPCPPAIFFEPHFFVLTNNASLVAKLVLFQVAFGTIQAAFYVAATVYYIIVKLPFSRVSIKTQKLQLKLFKGIMTTVFVSLFIYVLPMSIMVSTVILQVYDQELNNLAIAHVGNHGLLSTMFLIISMQPYKDRSEVSSSNHANEYRVIQRVERIEIKIVTV